MAIIKDIIVVDGVGYVYTYSSDPYEIMQFMCPNYPNTNDGETVKAQLMWQERFAGQWYDLPTIDDASPIGTFRLIWKII